MRAEECILPARPSDQRSLDSLERLVLVWRLFASASRLEMVSSSRRASLSTRESRTSTTGCGR
jgi:hypothetical protein